MTTATQTQTREPEIRGAQATGVVDTATFSRPARRDVEKAMTKTGRGRVSRRQASEFIDWMDDQLVELRRPDVKFVYVDNVAIQRFYHVLDMTLPHGEVVEPGTPGDLLQRHLLEPERGEIGLLHDMRARDGKPRHCYVQLRMASADIN